MDYELPRDLLRLAFEVKTGTRLSELGEVEPLSRDEWLARKRLYADNTR